MTFLTSRRDFLSASAACSRRSLGRASVSAKDDKSSPRGKAEHCIFLWLGGGAGQIDTWDPKQQGDPKAKKAGSYYKAIDTAIAACRFAST